MLYSFLRPLLFSLDAEKSHHITLTALNFFYRLGVTGLFSHVPQHTCQCFGIEFPNPIGLAAGLDKNGDYIDALFSLGFGFIEIGTVTPKPQAGNDKPRLFRLVDDQAIINRMGFNNKGVDYLVAKVKKAHRKGILGINIGKNASTPINEAAQDYLYCLEKVYDHADYVVINISSPNTADLRELQFGNYLHRLLAVLKAKQRALAKKFSKTVPLILKVAPDLDPIAIQNIAVASIEYEIDGIIVGNTTIQRDYLLNQEYSQQEGGLSGKPITALNIKITQAFHQQLHGQIPIINAGGIMSADDIPIRVHAGASLMQLYSGLIYRGPSLIRECVESYAKIAKQQTH